HEMQVPVLLPLLVGGLENGLVAAAAGVVDEDVAAAERFLGLGDEARAVRGLRHVGLDGERPNAVLLRDLCGLALGALAVARRDHHLHAFGRQPMGDGEADADAAAGDERDLALKTKLHSVLRSYLLLGSRWSWRPASRRGKQGAQRPIEV